MALLRPVRTRPPKLLAKAGKTVNVLAFEEKTRLTNFFVLLVEIDLHSPRAAKSKTRKRTKAKAKHIKDPCDIKCPAMYCSSRTAQRDLFLQLFTRIFNGNKINSR